MKNFKLFVAACAALALAASCQKYDDTALIQRIDKVENEVKGLTTRVSTLEGAVSALQTAVAEKYAVENIEKIENGYKINFTNGKSIELLNGAKGDKGDTGATGAQGDKGDKGDKGDTGEQGPQGEQGADGEDGQDGDSFLSSITSDGEFVTIVLSDESSTTFVLPMVVVIKIGGEETFVAFEGGKPATIELTLPEIEGVAVSATVFAQNGSTTAVVTKSVAGCGWTVAVAQDAKSVVVTPTSAKVGDAALLQVSLVKADGTTYTASKALKVIKGSVVYGDVTYPVVLMKDGNVWFAQNLRYVPEGKSIQPLASSYTQGVGDGIFYPATYSCATGAAVVTPSEDAEVIAAQGLLYTAAAAMNGEPIPTGDFADCNNKQGICPDGWHIPTAQEWVNLVGACAATAHNNVNAPYYVQSLAGADVTALNADGFNFIPYPYLNQGKTYLGSYLNKRADSEYNVYASMCYFQSSTGRSATQNYAAMITNNNTKTSVNCAYNFLTNGCPVRCVKNK